jgi:hypothetical protein
MKKWPFYLTTLLLLGVMVVITPSCKDDDDPMEPVATCDDGIQNGNETGVDCGGDCDPCIEGLMGEWQSSGANVAPLLVTLFATDSIYANFRTDNTYLVEQYDTAGTKLVLEGTYTQALSGVGQIWTIEVNQTSPVTLTSEGIFEIVGDVMNYEIVQTSPDIGAVPPTAQRGFGSTNAGALGMLNVQTYERIQ